MSDRLKSCPFCGSCAMLVCEKSGSEILYHVECQNILCGIRTPDSMTRNDAIDTWNRRQDEHSEEQIQEGAK
ncbi:MAG: Lar family restriction alleviation protein [Thermoguttaceae bacterium]|nr:Lar family restriction alleviation protein [Thermoguttaceae bacterium]